jgi:hypothetical protein
MPKKLQIKLLSQSAELLNVTNCAAGSISVLRSESPSELRPYQRALAGSQGKERFVIVVDGAEYRTEAHSLIGFGEAPPHTGSTVGQYLGKAGLPDGAITSLLVSFGLEGIVDKQCSTLTPDEERRVRIFAATADPSKALILNEPFEPISSQWRERLAEYLVDFARNRNGLVVVASLSYRPDSWIDNPTIVRQQVGQSLRKTIGFGAAGSEANAMINQLRDQLRQEESSNNQDRREQAPMAMAASLGAAAMSQGLPANTGGAGDWEYIEPVAKSWWQQALSMKVVTAAGASGLGIWAALTFTGITAHKNDIAKESSPQQVQASLAPAGTTAEQKGPQQQDVPQPVNVISASINKPRAEEVVKVALLLDGYSPAIRASLVDTSRGIMGDVTSDGGAAAPVEAAPPKDMKSGNLYKLLESAGSDKPEAGGDQGGAWQQEEAPSWSQPEQSSSEDYDPAREEERREAIRQKFLEAIRSAQERRDDMQE